MAFSTTATNVITQTGTDTSLAGLIGLAGVTSTTTSSAGGNARVVNIGSNRLIINGTLTVDPEFETLFQNSAAARPNIDVAGTLNIGRAVVVNSATRYSTGMAIHVGDNGSAWSETLASIRVTGTLNWYGGTLNLLSSFAWMEASTIRTYSPNAVLFMRALSGDGQAIQIRQRSGDCIVDGLTIVQANFTIIVPPTQLGGVSAFHAPGAVFSPSGSTASNTWITITDYDERGGNIVDFACWQRKWMRAFDNRNGSGVLFGGHLANDANNVGFLAIYQEVRASAQDVAGATVDELGIFLKDRLHITRTNRLPASRHGTNETFQPDRTYASKTTSGATLSQTVLIAVADKNTGGARFDNVTWDYRGETNTSADIFVLRFRSYQFLFSTMNVAMKGQGGTDVETVLFNDPAITQSAAVAAAHTGITVADTAPVAWNGKSYQITVTGNRTTNPSLTAADIFHYLKYHLSQTDVTFNGKDGGEWHNMVKATGDNFVTERGTYGGERVQKGVRVIDQAGNPFPGFNSMQADDGTIYIPPVVYTLTIDGFVSGSDVVIYDADVASTGDGSNVIQTFDEVVGTSVQYQYSYSPGTNIRIGVFEPGYKPLVTATIALTASNSTIPVSQQFDRAYG
jgi:hypothetical protein